VEKTFHNKKLCRKKEELYKRGNRSLVPPSETGRGLALPQHSFDSARPDPSLTHRPHPPHSFPSRCRWPLQPQLPKPSQTNQTPQRQQTKASGSSALSTWVSLCARSAPAARAFHVLTRGRERVSPSPPHPPPRRGAPRAAQPNATPRRWEDK
jgi:hypothetical protein